jgi:hypothetical protein
MEISKWWHSLVYNLAVHNFVLYSMNQTAERGKDIAERKNVYCDKRCLQDKDMSPVKFWLKQKIFRAISSY